MESNCLTILCIYNKEGNIKAWHRHLINGLKEVSSKLVIVANGTTPIKGIESLCDKVFYRNNEGYDFAAWRHALEQLGRDFVSTFDCLLLCNSSCYGPIVSLSPIMRKMNAGDADFWGLYEHPQLLENNILRHLQSYFLCFKNGLLNRDEFWNFWEELKIPKTWDDAVKIEINLTHYFEEFGFKGGSFLKSSAFNTHNPSILEPVELLKLGFPFLKRKVFLESREVFQGSTAGDQAARSLDYIQKNTNYSADAIIEDITECLPASSLTAILGLRYSLPTDYAISAIKKVRLGLVVYSYYSDLVDNNINYMCSMPSGSTIVIVVVDEGLRRIWEGKKRFIDRDYDISVRIQANRGRNEAAYWITCKDLQDRLDYICFVHDKKTPTLSKLESSSWSKHCYDSLLFNKAYVCNIVNLFECNRKFGMLIPTPPTVGGIDRAYLGCEWGDNILIGKDIFSKLNIKVPFDLSPMPSWGAMFWLRTDAIKSLYGKDWKVEDFPAEPIGCKDGTVLHALERLYPTIVQNSGYLTSIVSPDLLARIDFFNWYNKNRNFYTDDSKVGTKFLRCIIKRYVRQKIAKLINGCRL